MQGQAGNESGETESLRKNQKAIREIKLLTETQAAQNGSNRLASRSDTAKNPRARGYSKEKLENPKPRGTKTGKKQRTIPKGRGAIMFQAKQKQDGLEGEDRGTEEQHATVRSSPD